MQLVSIIRPLKKFCYVYDKVHVHSYKSTNDRQYCSWSYVVSLHRREELPFQLEGHNIHDDFAVAILKNSNTVDHVPRDLTPTLITGHPGIIAAHTEGLNEINNTLVQLALATSWMAGDRLK